MSIIYKKPTLIIKDSMFFVWYRLCVKKTLLILFSLLWCTYSTAGLLSDEEIKYNLQACKKGQYSSSNNQGISKSVLDRYCVCYVNKIDQNLTKKDIKYFKENGTYPERYNQLVFESSKQCYLKEIVN